MEWNGSHLEGVTLRYLKAKLLLKSRHAITFGTSIL